MRFSLRRCPWVRGVNVVTRPLRDLEISLGAWNITDAHYADPASDAHVQSAIARDGRTYRLKIGYAF